MQYVTATIAIILLIIVLVFSIQNWAAVDVNFFWWTMSTPKIFLILGTYLLGMVTGWGLVELAKRAIDSN